MEKGGSILRKDRLKSLRKIVRSKLPEITEKRSDDPNYYDDRVMPDGYGEKIFEMVTFTRVALKIIAHMVMVPCFSASHMERLSLHILETGQRRPRAMAQGSIGTETAMMVCIGEVSAMVKGARYTRLVACSRESGSTTNITAKVSRIS